MASTKLDVKNRGKCPALRIDVGWASSRAPTKTCFIYAGFPPLHHDWWQGGGRKHIIAPGPQAVRSGDGGSGSRAGSEMHGGVRRRACLGSVIRVITGGTDPADRESGAGRRAGDGVSVAPCR